VFAVDPRCLLTSAPDFPLIAQDYEVLHYDEMPILFTGITRYQARVLCSSVDEDMDLDRFFHVIVTPDTYSRFLRRKISYRDIIAQSQTIFIVDMPADGRAPSVFMVDVAAIPSEYMPLEDSYCPERAVKQSMTFDVSMRGRRADMHQAYPNDVRTIESSLSGVISDALISVSETKAPPQTVISPYGQGSFRLRFSVEETQQSRQLVFTDALRSDFAVAYLDFCLNRFQDEFDAVASGDLRGAPYFRRLLQTYNRISQFADIAPGGGYVSGAELQERLLNAVRRSVDRLTDIADILGMGFTSLDIFSVEDDDEALISTFDAAVAVKIGTSIEMYDAKIGGLWEDPSFKPYEILVYNLNTETRKGSAYLIRPESMPRVRIAIDGSGALEQTKFTESLYKNVKIQVNARAKGTRDRITSMRIEYAV